MLNCHCTVADELLLAAVNDGDEFGQIVTDDGLDVIAIVQPPPSPPPPPDPPPSGPITTSGFIGTSTTESTWPFLAVRFVPPANWAFAELNCAVTKVKHKMLKKRNSNERFQHEAG